MKRVFLMFSLTLVYMELIYHFASFGFCKINPVFMIPGVLFLAGLETVCVGFFRKRKNKVLLWIFLAADFLLYASQLVYISIFKQPLLAAAVTGAGKAAVTNYWREALTAILQNAGYLALLAIPLVVTGVLLHFEVLTLKSHKSGARLGALAFTAGGILLSAVLLFAGYQGKREYYEEYQGFYDPATIVEEYGILASVQREALGNVLPECDSAIEGWAETEGTPESTEDGLPDGADGAEDGTENETAGEDGTENGVPEGTEDGTEDGTQEQQPPEKTVDTSPNVLPVDFERLSEMADTKELQKLVSFMQSREPTKKNEFTGMFEGYNLIYLTAEGFSPYAIDENVTPTLYKLTHSGFVAKDYYVPLWQTSTSDGEYVNMTGLIPDQQFSMERSAENKQPFSLPAYFAREGVKSLAYHNNTLSYYDRYLSHPNMGYDFRASKLGDLSEAEWGSHVFPMENANFWPASDLDMMKATIPEYIQEDRFHVYYMTVSGHMNYNFKGNKMAGINREAVAGLPYSEEGRAYIACNVELDKALAYLIEELEKAGKLEKTVIALSADHYPYAMEMANLEELAGRPLDGTLDLYRNSLILWNSEMETVEITKPCSAEDLLPTLMNLFGFDYDSRLYAGSDMLSDAPGLVIFANRSFITDTVEYNKKAKTTVSRTGDDPVDEEYRDAVKKQVKGIYEFSAGILNNDFYKYVEQALPDFSQP